MFNHIHGNSNHLRLSRQFLYSVNIYVNKNVMKWRQKTE